jgi:hypothetical protein
MLDVTQVLTTRVVECIRENYAAIFGSGESEYSSVAISAAATAFGHIGTSDALYHNVEHTSHVTLVGLEILRGKHLLNNDLGRDAWLNTIIAFAYHDIGYVRGICGNDDGNSLSTGVNGKNVRLMPGSSDAALMPVHVDRGIQFVEEYFKDMKLVDVAHVQSCIERTRFPVPPGAAYARTDDYPGLVRGADLIGQLSDPRYLYKLAAVFYEFEEIGFNESTGYLRPGDLLWSYPRFFENSVAPYIAGPLTCLKATEEGREIITQLYANLDEARQQEITPRIMAGLG